MSAKRSKKQGTKSIYDVVNESITERLKQGEIPWRPKWKGAESPKNVVTQEEYRGINAMILLSQKRDGPYWLTERQMDGLNGRPKSDARAVEIVRGGDVDQLMFVLLQLSGRVHTDIVINAEDVDGIEAHVPQQKHKCSSDFVLAQAIVDGYKKCPRITSNMEEVGIDNPCYVPALDLLGIFEKNRFYCEDGYYVTLYHELVHSTGHPSRLHRFKHNTKIPPQVISQVMQIREHHMMGIMTRVEAVNELKRLEKQVLRDESMEELIAEFGAAYLAAEGKIDATTIDDSSIYINGWLKKAGEDETMLVTAAAKAQEAVNYIMGRDTKTGA